MTEELRGRLNFEQKRILRSAWSRKSQCYELFLKPQTTFQYATKKWDPRWSDFMTPGTWRLSEATKLWSDSWELLNILAEEMAPTMRSILLVVYPVHDTLLNFSAKIRYWMTINGQTLVGFLLMCCSDERLEWEGSSKDEDLFVRVWISVFAESAMREFRTCSCRFSREVTKNKSTTRCKESNHWTSTKIWPELVL